MDLEEFVPLRGLQWGGGGNAGRWIYTISFTWVTLETSNTARVGGIAARPSSHAGNQTN